MSKEVRVKSLEWLSEEGKEAVLCISDEIYSCLVYAHPCDLIPGDLINQPLLATPEGVEIVKFDALGFKKMSGSFDYEITAQVINLKENLLKVGSIIIEFGGYLPGDTVEGDIVNFVCSRLACMD